MNHNLTLNKVRDTCYLSLHFDFALILEAVLIKYSLLFSFHSNL